MEEALQSRLSAQVQMQRRRVAGLAAVAGILQAADGRTGMQILDNLADHDQNLAERLRPQPLAFDALADVRRARAGRGGPRWPTGNVLLTALIGAAPELVDRVLAGSRRRRPPAPAANSTSRARSACATWKRPAGRSPAWPSARCPERQEYLNH